jgi:hypothetical protein
VSVIPLANIGDKFELKSNNTSRLSGASSHGTLFSCGILSFERVREFLILFLPLVLILLLALLWAGTRRCACIIWHTVLPHLPTVSILQAKFTGLGTVVFLDREIEIEEKLLDGENVFLLVRPDTTFVVALCRNGKGKFNRQHNLPGLVFSHANIFDVTSVGYTKALEVILSESLAFFLVRCGRCCSCGIVLNDENIPVRAGQLDFHSAGIFCVRHIPEALYGGQGSKSRLGVDWYIGVMNGVLEDVAELSILKHKRY